MRKNNFFILFIAAVCVLASCMTGNDVYPENGSLTKTGISFVITDTDEDTKALEVTTENITSFEATAMYAGSESQYFGSLNFTGSGSPKKFTSSSSPLWPKGSSLDFYAYSTGSATGQVSKSNYKTFTVTPASSAAAQVDFVYACGKDQNINTLVDGNTQLTFLHTQSKVSVKVKNPSSEYKAVITGWRLGYFDESGTFTHDGSSTASISAFDPSCWTNNTSPSALNTYTMDLSSSPVSVAASAVEAISLAGEMIVVPQSTPMATNYANAISGAKVNGSYVALKIKLMDDSSSKVLYGGEDGEWAIWPTNFSWNPGQQYSYIINISKSGYQESNPSNETIELASMFPKPLPKFGGLNIAPGNLYFTGTEYLIDNDWNNTSYGSISGQNAGSYYFCFYNIGGYFDNMAWGDRYYNIGTSGSKVTFDGYDDWRVPTSEEWKTIVGLNNSRNGAIVNGTIIKAALVTITDLSYAGSTSPYGILVFPDDKTISGVTVTKITNTYGNTMTNMTLSDLNNYLDQDCIFLPGGGFYYGNTKTWNNSGYGYYLSATRSGNTTAYYLYLGNGSVDTRSDSSGGSKNQCFMSVRLVRTAE